MGKKQHSKDRLFITQTEHKYLYGGKKAKKTAYRRLPFNYCAITLCPFHTPVCTPQGHVFDLEAISSHMESNNTNPVNGQPLTLSDLIRLKFHKNEKGEYYCPITYKVFTDYSKITAIASSGNVFSQDAIDELNIKPKYWKDLLTGEPFKRKDILVLQDPQNSENREITNFEHLRRAAEAQASKQSGMSSSTKNIRTNAATSRIFKEMEDKRQAKKSLEAKQLEVKQLEVDSKKKDVETKKEVEKVEKSGALQFAHYTVGEVSRSFTSSAAVPVTENTLANASDELIHEKRWRAIRMMKHKGYVRFVTNIGDLNLEIDCDFVPQTADNFMGLCRSGYYDGVIFHRVIQRFMAQTGDPTGTGTGGQSIWKKAFPNEIDSRLSHNARGILSMANSGSNTNRSQFFITFMPCPHLDKRHSVFGRVVGGMSTLDRLEQVPTRSSDHRPLEDMRIERVHIYADPFDTYDRAMQQGEDPVAQAKEKRLKSRMSIDDASTTSVLKIGGEWVTLDHDTEGDKELHKHLLEMETTRPQREGAVGKYLPANIAPETHDHAALKASQDASISVLPVEGKANKKRKNTVSFGDFSKW